MPTAKKEKKIGKGLECISLENLCSWPKGTWKDTQHQQSLGKGKLKPSFQTHFEKKKEIISNVGRDVT